MFKVRSRRVVPLTPAWCKLTFAKSLAGSGFVLTDRPSRKELQWKSNQVKAEQRKLISSLYYSVFRLPGSSDWNLAICHMWSWRPSTVFTGTGSNVHDNRRSKYDEPTKSQKTKIGSEEQVEINYSKHTPRSANAWKEIQATNRKKGQRGSLPLYSRRQMRTARSMSRTPSAKKLVSQETRVSVKAWRFTLSAERILY